MLRLENARNTNSKSDIGISLATLVLVAVVPLLVFCAGVAWLVIEQKKSAVSSELASTARALMVAVDRELESQFVAMDVLLTDISIERGDFKAFNKRAQLIVKNGSWLNVALIDPLSHRIVASGLPLASPSLVTSSPSEVDDVARTRKSMLVGVLVDGETSSKPVVLFLAPVVLENEVRYVLATVVDTTRLSDLFVEQHMALSWTGAILDKHLRLAGRSRDAARYVGAKATPTLADRVVASQEGMFYALNQEGNSVYTVFSRSQKTDWTVVIGIPTLEVDVPIRQALTELTIIGGALMVFALLLAGFVGRTIVRQRSVHENSLNESASRLNMALSGADMVMWDWHISNGDLVFNARWAEILGLSLAELPVRVERWETRVHPDDRSRVRENIELHLAGEAAIYESEHRVLHEDGSWVWVLGRGKVVEWDGKGRPVRAMGTALGITERKRTEAALRESEERFRQIFFHAPIGMAVVSLDGVVREANLALGSMLGYGRDELSGMLLAQFFRDKKAIEDCMPLEGDSIVSLERPVTHRNGQHIPTICTFTVLRGARNIPTNGMVQIEDVSERKQVQLQSLAKGILAAQERDRRQLSHELHDEVGQSLTALRITLKRAGHDLSNAEKLASCLDDGQQIIERLMREVRGIASRLRPSELDQLGLSATLRSYLDKTIRPLGLEVALFENLGDARLVPDLELCCFRVVQEALTNALRHAEASRIEVCLTLDAACLVLSVGDNGHGFDAERVYSSLEKPRSLGLIGMRERVTANAGKIRIRSTPGEGTSIVVSFDLNGLNNEQY